MAERHEATRRLGTLETERLLGETLIRGCVEGSGHTASEGEDRIIPLG